MVFADKPVKRTECSVTRSRYTTYAVPSLRDTPLTAGSLVTQLTIASVSVTLEINGPALIAGAVVSGAERVLTCTMVERVGPLPSISLADALIW